MNCGEQLQRDFEKCRKDNPIKKPSKPSLLNTIWELFVWSIDPNKSGDMTKCLYKSLSKFNDCILSKTSSKYKISNYTDDWGIFHSFPCNNLITDKETASKILGCDGRTLYGISNPNLNASKGKVIDCNVSNENPINWCACPGYPSPNTESHFDENKNSCVCNNSSYVPHYHYDHNQIGTDGKIITCCGPICPNGFEYDCIKRECKKSLYNI